MEITDQQLLDMQPGMLVSYDTECLPNYFLIKFNFGEDQFLTFEQSDHSQINTEKLLWVLWRFCFFGFNNLNYDDLLIFLLINKKPSCEELKLASDKIIQNKMRSYEFCDFYGFKIPEFNRFDLMEVAPLKGKLKLYAARLHVKHLQEMPIHHTQYIYGEQINLINSYCEQDTRNNKALLAELFEAVMLRYEMSHTYNTDLRSKSDAQIAEAVIKSEYKKLTGSEARRPPMRDIETIFVQYTVPDFISFECPQLNALLTIISRSFFGLGKDGKPKAPPELEGYTVEIAGVPYAFGMGGLHSREEKARYIAENGWQLSDDDVESFYPRTILNQNLFPEHLGETFLKIYEEIVKTRIEAKHKSKSEDPGTAKHYKSIANALKIVINGLFGKFGNIYSVVFSPKLLLQVTVTGQLVLLMLIEKMQKAAIRCVSANTDGIVTYFKNEDLEKQKAVISEWEKITNYKTEKTFYSQILSRDVNNYMAIKMDKTIKTKGIYSEKGSALDSALSKNPDSLIIATAIKNYLLTGEPIEQFIHNCEDLKQFLCVRTVKEGGQFKGEYLGEIVRWYYSTESKEAILYVKNGNMVAKSQGAMPCMTLPDELPQDIDYKKYIEMTIEQMYNLAIYKKPYKVALF